MAWDRSEREKVYFLYHFHSEWELGLSPVFLLLPPPPPPPRTVYQSLFSTVPNRGEEKVGF